MKNSATFSLELIFFIFASLKKFYQSICSCICFAFTIPNLKIVSKKLLDPINLSGAQTLCIHETKEVIVIRKNKNLIFAVFQVVVPILECFNNSQKLTIVDFLSYFRWNYFLRKERYSMPLAQIGSNDYFI